MLYIIQLSERLSEVTNFIKPNHFLGETTILSTELRVEAFTDI